MKNLSYILDRIGLSSLTSLLPFLLPLWGRPGRGFGRGFGFALLCMFSSCDKPAEPVVDQPLAMTVSQDSVYCLPIYGDLPALELAWTSGTNHGTGSAIAYTVEMDTVGGQFAGGLHWEIGRTANRTLVLSHAHLADTLALIYPEMEEDRFTLFECRVRAKILLSGEELISEPVRVRIAWNTTMLTALYLIGDATPNGWDLGRATSMLIDMNRFSSFSWTGQLHKGEIKLLTTHEDWFPCYVRDTTDEQRMVYRPTEETYPDFKWYIAKTGNYRIEADIDSLTMHITYLGGEAYSHIYMIGDATPGGWSWDQLTELQHPEPNVFTYEGTLSAGEIKFPTEIKSDWTGEMIYAPTPNCEPSANGTFEIRAGGDDNKWVIPSSGDWSIRINLNDTTISIVKS